jgi:hypothetical protein
MKIAEVNAIRIPVEATDCTILRNVQTASKATEIKIEWNYNLPKHMPS